MDNSVLKTEILELPTQRLLTKLQYLQQENIQVNHQMKQIKHELKLAKDQVAAMIPPYNEVAQYLFNESQEKSRIIEEVQEARNRAQTEALLNNQVAQQAQSFYTDLMSEFEEKIQELRRIIHDKEYTIQELEKIKPIQDGENIITKYKEVVSLNEQTLRYHNEIEGFQQSILKQSKEITRQNDLIASYVQENRNLKFEMTKIKYALQNQVNFSKIKECISRSFEILSDDENQLLNLKRPIKLAPRLSNNIADEHQKGKTTTTQLTSFMSQKNERMTKLEFDTDRYKKLFERETINNKLLSDQLDKLSRYTINLLTTNETLLKANNTSTKINYKTNRQYQFLDQFWKTYLQHIADGFPVKDSYDTNVLLELIKHKQQQPEPEQLVQILVDEFPEIPQQKAKSLRLIRYVGQQL